MNALKSLLLASLICLILPSAIYGQVFGGMPGPARYRAAAVADSDGGERLLFQARIASPVVLSVERDMNAGRERFEVWFPLHDAGRTHNLLPIVSTDDAGEALGWRVHYTFRRPAWHANATYDDAGTIRFSAGAWVFDRLLPVPEVAIPTAGDPVYAMNARLRIADRQWVQVRYSRGVTTAGLYLHWD